MQTVASHESADSRRSFIVVVVDERLRGNGSPIFLKKMNASTYYFGKIAFDQCHNYSVSATWLETSSKERPRGAYAGEALEKRIEA